MPVSYVLLLCTDARFSERDGDIMISHLPLSFALLLFMAPKVDTALTLLHSYAGRAVRVCVFFVRFKGTRLDGEKDFYEEYFGGSLRAHNIMISAADGSNVASPQGLDAMVEVERPS